MTTVGIRDLGRNPSGVVDEVSRTGRPAIVTKNGRPLAVMLPISEEDLEDYILANAPSFVRARNEAERDFADHRTRSLRDSLADIGEDLPAGTLRPGRGVDPRVSRHAGLLSIRLSRFIPRCASGTKPAAA